MATKNPTQGNQTMVNTALDDQLKQTEIGAWIAERKGLAITLVVLILCGVIGWGIFQNQMEGSNNKKAGVVYAFTQSSLKDFSDKKIEVAALMTAHQKLHNDLSGFKGLFTNDLIVADHLVKVGNNNEAKKVLEGALPLAKDAVQAYLVRSRMAVVYEDLGEFKNAISVLEDLNSSQTKLMESKNYLDLGRLYMAVGMKDKAKVNFEYVLNNMAQDEFAKLAKLYLSELD
ncbi:MAG: tetratricopeptide repeat protein [Bacteriovoracaceae bacterium]|nr:tetratricopeptide repeat protein [Bacteriovoracaceae bacterium]